MEFEKFGDYLRVRRNELGISQNDLERKTAMERSYISMLENKGNPSYSKIKELSDAMGLSLEDFFKTSTKEASPPTIFINFKKGETEKMHKERIIKNECVPIPIINNDKPLKSGKIEDKDIEAYIMLDKSTLGELDGQKLVAVRHLPSIPFPLIILDLNAKVLTEGEVYAIEDKGIVLRKPFMTGTGIVLQSIYGTDKPMAIFGRQKDFIKVIGKAVFACIHFAIENLTNQHNSKI